MKRPIIVGYADRLKHSELTGTIIISSNWFIDNIPFIYDYFYKKEFLSEVNGSWVYEQDRVLYTGGHVDAYVKMCFYDDCREKYRKIRDV